LTSMDQNSISRIGRIIPERCAYSCSFPEINACHVFRMYHGKTTDSIAVSLCASSLRPLQREESHSTLDPRTSHSSGKRWSGRLCTCLWQIGSVKWTAGWSAKCLTLSVYDVRRVAVTKNRCSHYVRPNPLRASSVNISGLR
jgi:hypothetical protein